METTPVPEMQPLESSDPLGKVVRIGQLLDLYGGLLTERQSKFVRMHYEEDLSFGEIARTHNVSRQAIHDAVKHAIQSLEEYEDKLGLLSGGVKRPSAQIVDAAGDEDEPASHAPEGVSNPESLRASVEKLREIHGRLRRSGGIIYNAEGITRSIGEVLDSLETLIPKE